MEPIFQCPNCKNYFVADLCRAFPKGIPDLIQFAEVDHKFSYPGDNGIRYEPIEPDPQVVENESQQKDAGVAIEADRKKNVQAIEVLLSSVRGIMDNATEVKPIVFRKEGVYPNYRAADLYANRDLDPDVETFAAAILDPVAVFRDFRLNQSTGETTSTEEYISIIRNRQGLFNLVYILVAFGGLVKMEVADLYLSDLKANYGKPFELINKASGACIYNKLLKKAL